jgi:hypothetical protein
MALGKVKISRIGNLPRAIAEGVAAVVDGEILVGSGGDGEKTHREIFKLVRPNLTTVRWESLGWPEDARGRMYPVAGVKGGKLYLFGGRDFAESDEKRHKSNLWIRFFEGLLGVKFIVRNVEKVG